MKWRLTDKYHIKNKCRRIHNDRNRLAARIKLFVLSNFWHCAFVVTVKARITFISRDEMIGTDYPVAHYAGALSLAGSPMIN